MPPRSRKHVQESSDSDSDEERDRPNAAPSLILSPHSQAPLSDLVFYLIDTGVPDSALAQLDSLIPQLGAKLLPDGADPAAADYLLTGLTSPTRIGRHIPRRKDIRVLDYRYPMDCAKEGRRLGIENYEIVVKDEFS
jgi:hypothetical protein